MNERIEELLAKYWDTETSLAEEAELKDLIKSAEGYTSEKELFGLLAEFHLEEPELKMKPRPKAKQRRLRSHWMSWAASIAILAGSFWGWRRAYEQQEAERQAYEEVMMAFAIVQTNLQKGKSQMQPMNDLKYLNTTNQLFDNSLPK